MNKNALAISLLSDLGVEATPKNVERVMNDFHEVESKARSSGYTDGYNSAMYDYSNQIYGD